MGMITFRIMTADRSIMDESTTRFANLVVRDTVLSSHDDPELAGDETVKVALKQLKGPDGRAMVHGVITQYLGGLTSSRESGVEPTFDREAIGSIQSINMASLGPALINGLQDYLGLGTAARARALEGFRQDRLRATSRPEPR
jgi:hypothetical protein